MPIIPLIVWGAQRHLDQGPSRKRWAATRFRSRSAVGAPMAPAGTVERTDAATARGDDDAAVPGAGGLRASRGRVLGAAAARRRARRRWPRRRCSTSAELAERARKQAERQTSDPARPDRQRRRRHAARRRREGHPAHPRRRARRRRRRRAVRARHRPAAAVDRAGRRRARLRADGGVRQRRGDLRPGDRPDRVGAHAVGRRSSASWPRSPPG